MMSGGMTSSMGLSGITLDLVCDYIRLSVLVKPLQLKLFNVSRVYFSVMRSVVKIEFTFWLSMLYRIIFIYLFFFFLSTFNFDETGNSYFSKSFFPIFSKSGVSKPPINALDVLVGMKQEAQKQIHHPSIHPSIHHLGELQGIISKMVTPIFQAFNSFINPIFIFILVKLHLFLQI